MDLLEVSRLNLKRSRLQKRFVPRHVGNEIILEDFSLVTKSSRGLVFARALLTKPEWLICHGVTDRPDDLRQSGWINLLRRLRETFPLTLLGITDNLAVASHLGDDIAVLNQGGLLETGTAEAVVNRPCHDHPRRPVSCSR